ncbi:MAG: cobalamin-independent methionine synthase II family protein [Mesorhizobium sp.]|nr:cobalamin-independent methionine synthase II family protein [Mesorhizobium sp.]MCO5162235.1 cobalamin-independent methionine synthase II family protein [Mesorhizobium sp.]
MTAHHFRTTHVGSLPRGEELSAMLIAREVGAAVDERSFLLKVEARVEEIVARQVDAGIDWINDGEQGRAGFQTYIAERMAGFGGESQRASSLDYDEFPTFSVMARRGMGPVAKIRNAPMAIGPVLYESTSAIEAECSTLAGALKKRGLTTSEAFLTAPSPGIVATTLHNRHYDSHDDYLDALVGALRVEYEAILAAGYSLQIDAPDLAMERGIFFKHLSTEDFVKRAQDHLDAINAAVTGLPAERIRLHCCWGNWDGPHLHDVPLEDLLPILSRAKVGAFSIPFANPRHQHEYAALRFHGLPKDALLLPGIVDTTCNYVEHPEVVALRILDAVEALGDAERVIPSTDCGFGTFAGYEFVAEELVWKKLRALRDGADFAASRL